MTIQTNSKFASKKFEEISISTLQKWSVVITGSLLFFYVFVQINMLNPIGAVLMRDFSINATQLGNLSGMYFYGNFIMLFLSGILLDRFSPKKMIILAMINATVFMFIFGITDNFWIAALSRFFIGFSGAFSLSGTMRLVSRWFPPNKIALPSGIILALGMLGGMLAQTPMELASVAFGWHAATNIIGYMGCVIILLMLLIVKDHPKKWQSTIPECGESPTKKVRFWQSLKLVSLNKYNWLSGLCSSLLNLPIFLLGSLWGSMFLVQAKQFNEIQASNLNLFLFLGVLIGSPLIGYISDRIYRRVLPMVICIVTALIAILFIMYADHLSFSQLIFMYFLLGLALGAQALGYSLIVELNPPAVMSSALNISSLVLMMSGFIGQPLFGWLLGLNWDHTLVNNIAVYSVANFRMALWLIPIGFILSLISVLFIKEPHSRTL